MARLENVHQRCKYIALTILGASIVTFFPHRICCPTGEHAETRNHLRATGSDQIKRCALPHLAIRTGRRVHSTGQSGA
jgi:hypothetical protein